MKKNLKLFYFFIVCIFISIVCSKLNFGYTSIIKVYHHYEDLNYVDNLKLQSVNIDNYFKNNFIEMINIDENDKLSWINNCIKKDSSVLCNGTMNFKFDLWSISKIKSRIAKYTIMEKENENYEKFNFDFDKMIEHSFNNLGNFQNLYLIKEDYLSRIREKIILNGTDFLIPHIKNFITNDLKKNFVKRYISIESNFRMPLNKIQILLYLKILLVITFANILVYFLFYKFKR